MSVSPCHFSGRKQALRQEVQPRRPDRELVGFRPEQPAVDADPAADIEHLKILGNRAAAARPA
jgi:hypothetical protein